MGIPTSNLRISNRAQVILPSLHTRYKNPYVVTIRLVQLKKVSVQHMYNEVSTYRYSYGSLLKENIGKIIKIKHEYKQAYFKGTVRQNMFHHLMISLKNIMQQVQRLKEFVNRHIKNLRRCICSGLKRYFSKVRKV